MSGTSWIAEPIVELMTAIAKQYGKAAKVTITIDQELAIAAGLAPGQEVTVSTPAGPVKVLSKCDHSLLKNAPGRPCFYCGVAQDPSPIDWSKLKLQPGWNA